MSDKHDAQKARACEMDLEQWRAAKQSAQSARSRGRGKALRPESSLWEDVPGQMDLFGDQRG